MKRPDDGRSAGPNDAAPAGHDSNAQFEDPGGIVSDDGDHEAGTDSALKHLFGRGLLFGLIYVAQSAVMILVTPLIVRLLGSHQFGLVAVILTVGQVLVIVAGLGMQTGLHRHFADEEGDQETRSLLTMSILIALAITVLVDVTGPYWAKVIGFPYYTSALRCGVWWAGLAAVGSLIAAVLRSQERLVSFLVVLGIQAIGSQLIALGLVIGLAHTALAYIGGLLIGQAIGTLVGLLLTRPAIRGLPTRAAFWGCLAISLPLVPHGLALQVLNLGDRVIVQRDLGSTPVARYQVAYNAAAFPIVLLTILNTAWQPRIFAVSPEQRRAVLSRARDQLLRLMTPTLLGTALVAPLALRILAPASFNRDGLLVVYALVACSTLPYLVYLSNLRTLLAFRRTSNMMWATPLCAVLNIVLNIWLVPVYGINGSALATLLSFTVLAAVTAVVGAKVCRLDRTPWTEWVGPLVAAGLTFGCIKLPSTSVVLVLRMAGVVGCGVWILLLLRAAGRPNEPGKRRYRHSADIGNGLRARLGK